MAAQVTEAKGVVQGLLTQVKKLKQGQKSAQMSAEADSDEGSACQDAQDIGAKWLKGVPGAVCSCVTPKRQRACTYGSSAWSVSERINHALAGDTQELDGLSLWIYDSGAGRICSYSQDDFVKGTLRPSYGQVIYAAGGEKHPVKYVGRLRIREVSGVLIDSGKVGAWYVPSMKYKLASATAFKEMGFGSVLGIKGKPDCLINQNMKDRGDGVISLSTVNGVYTFNADAIPRSSALNFVESKVATKTGAWGTALLGSLYDESKHGGEPPFTNKGKIQDAWSQSRFSSLPMTTRVPSAKTTGVSCAKALLKTEALA